MTYVSNIYKSYTAYTLIEEQDVERKAAREQLKGSTPSAAPTATK